MQFSTSLHCGLRILQISILFYNSLSYLSATFRWITHIDVRFNIKNKSPRAPNSGWKIQHFINTPWHCINITCIIQYLTASLIHCSYFNNLVVHCASDLRICEWLYLFTQSSLFPLCSSGSPTLFDWILNNKSPRAPNLEKNI